MRGAIFSSLILTISSITACSGETADICTPAGYSISDIRQMKTDGFDTIDSAQRLRIAMDLTPCVGHPDSEIRDALVYESLQSLLRGNLLEVSTVKALKTDLLTRLEQPDKQGFTRPFAALILAEVARVDRVSPYLTAEERSDFVKAAADYMISITDYRGFSDKDGWRHGVAHGADWLMQFALNPKLTPEDIALIRNAVAAQVSPNSHAYTFGEAERLARPILYLAASGAYTETEWTAWLAEISSPAPLENWGEAYKSEADLARLHNLKAFMDILYVNTSLTQNENLKTLLPGTIASIKTLP